MDRQTLDFYSTFTKYKNVKITSKWSKMSTHNKNEGLNYCNVNSASDGQLSPNPLAVFPFLLFMSKQFYFSPAQATVIGNSVCVCIFHSGLVITTQ